MNTLAIVSLSTLAVIVAYLVLMIVWEWAIGKASDYAATDDDWRWYTATNHSWVDEQGATYTTSDDLGWRFSQSSRQVARADTRRRECKRIRKEHKTWPRERVRDLAIRGIAWE